MKKKFNNWKKWLSFSVTDIVDIAIQVRGLIVYRPAFGCCGHPKAGLNTFLAVFMLFSSFQPFCMVWRLEENQI